MNSPLHQPALASEVNESGPQESNTEDKLFQTLLTFFGAVGGTDDPRAHRHAAHRALLDVRRLRKQNREEHKS